MAKWLGLITIATAVRPGPALQSTFEGNFWLCDVLLQVAEHKRAVDRMLEEKRERYEEARRAEEAEAAARCAQCYNVATSVQSKPQPEVVLHHCDMLGAAAASSCDYRK
jgi:hypothetical protein